MKIQKCFRILLIVVTVIIALFIANVFADKEGASDHDIHVKWILDTVKDGECYFPESGFVPDAESAIKIAEAVWVPIYGEETIFDELPFNATLFEDSLWIVYGSFNYGEEGDFVAGGVAHAIIRKSDGRVTCVIHGE